MEEPLAPDVQKDIITTFLTFYNLLRIDSRRILSDPQLGRFRRECQLGAPSNYAIMRLKSLAAGQMAAPVKKERLSDFLEFSAESWVNKLNGKYQNSCLNRVGAGSIWFRRALARPSQIDVRSILEVVSILVHTHCI